MSFYVLHYIIPYCFLSICYLINFYYLQMDDDELQMLQREFMNIQQEKTNPLAERTVAQIMVKLHHEGFKFYSTTDGNEYLTPEKLDQEILTLILDRGHMSIGILPQILNVGSDTIEARVIKLLTKYSSQSTSIQDRSLDHKRIYRHNTLLLSQKHLVSIIESIKQLLMIQGKVNLQRISLQNQFNIKFTEKFIKENISSLDAELVNNQLITKQYNLMKKSKLVGYLRAVSNPISFQNIVKTSKLSENDDIKTIEKLINEIIQQKKVKAKYQNSYYIPDSFIINQKQKILEFFASNGFIQFEMLQKQFLVSKPLEWVKKNLDQSKQFAGKYVIFEELCILTEKLEHFAHSIVEMLNHEGFLQISHVLPFALQEKELQKFLNDFCRLKDYTLNEGYCYSEKWLQKVTEQFKEKVFKSIFENNQSKSDAKNKKKGGKKDKSTKFIEEDELIQKLFNEGLAEYSVAQNIAPILMPIITIKLEDQKKKFEKLLGQNKGILNNTFLKYRSCNTIMRNIDGLQRNLNIIEKQKKKNTQKWVDKDFGPNQNDQKGVYSLIYYDNILPKGWPSLEEGLKWEPTNLKRDQQHELCLISNSSIFCQLLRAIQIFNKRSAGDGMLSIPFVQQKQIQKFNNQSPYVFSFYRSESDRRYVMVDSNLPMLNNKCVGYSGIYGLAQKAYAKFRYCYKGILNLSIKTLLFEMTGSQPIQHTFDKNNEKDLIEIVKVGLKEKKLIIFIAEGENGRINHIQVEEGHEPVSIVSMRPYLCTTYHKQGDTQFFQIFEIQVESQIRGNQGKKLPFQVFSRAFKHIYMR